MRILFAVLLSASCTTLALKQDHSTRKPFTIVISCENPIVKAGAEVWMKVQLTNNSDQELDASGGFSDLTGLDPNFLFDVRDGRGHLVSKRMYQHPELESGHPVNRTVKPGATLEQEQRPSRLYDMSRPGKYVIQVSRRVSDNPRDGAIKSNRIWVTVSP